MKKGVLLQQQHDQQPTAEPSMPYEKQCFLRMVHGMDKAKKMPHKADQEGLDDKSKLDMLIESTYHPLKRRPVQTRLEVRLEKTRRQRHSWHLHEQRKVSANTAMVPKTSAAVTKQQLRRACSADSRTTSGKAKICCDVSTLTASPVANPPLEVIGTKPQIGRGSPSSRSTTPESESKHVGKRVRYSTSTLEELLPMKPQSKIVRSRQILKELQRQLRPTSGEKKKSPYVVLRQKSVCDMHNLVLELDNNLSFGDHSKEDKEEPQLSKNEIDEKLTNLMSESCLKSVQVDPQLFSLEDSAIIGKGTFSSVYKCQLYGMDVAVKVFECRMSSSGNQEKLIKRWKVEGELMLQLRHPHIVQLVGACQQNGVPMLAFEYLESGSLSHYIHDVIRNKLDHGSFFSIARDVALALNYLHKQQRPVVHLDIKSANVLLDAYLRAKVADLGLARVIEQEVQDEGHMLKVVDEISLSGPRGTPAWMAPEMLKEGHKITVATDIYGLGLILWEMKAAKKPFGGLTMAQVCNEISTGGRPSLPNDLTEDVQNIICQCWSQDPCDRPTCGQILGTLNRLSFPDNWKALLGPGSSMASQSPPIKTFDSSDEDQIDGQNDDDDDNWEMEPRPPLTRSYSAPAPAPPPPPPPPPPPTLLSPCLHPLRPPIMPKPILHYKKTINEPQASFSVTSTQIKNQLSRLKTPQGSTSKVEAATDDLASLLRKVLDQRRGDAGWCDNSSSNASSGRVSRCSISNKGSKMSTVSWSGDDY